MSEKSQKVEITNKAFDKYVSFLTKKERAEIAATARAQENAKMQKVVDKLQESILNHKRVVKEFTDRIKEYEKREECINKVVDKVESWLYDEADVIDSIKTLTENLNGFIESKDKLLAFKKVLKEMENLY